MPWKDPDFWRIEFMAPLLAVVTATLRVVYDQEETRFMRICLEAIICGLLTVAAGAAIKALGLPHEWSMFAGGAIGFMGSHFIRSAATRFVNRRADK
jgi:lambda family phage holin